ncbi:MAG TPA: STAS domain-containing protein [Herpetosiphonaceae bacterium]
MPQEDSPNVHQLTLNNVPFEWRPDAGSLSFFGLSAALFWLNPSLLNVLRPLAEEVGVPVFRLLLAHNASLGTDEDYNAMVTALGSTFAEGFLAWGAAVAAAGWGAFEMPEYDPAAGTALVVVRNPWELRMQQGSPLSWGCPFLQGKLIGIFTHAFGRRCWADEQPVAREDGEPAMAFRLYPADTTIEEQLARLRRERKAADEREREAEIQRKTQELQTTEARLRGMLEELSTPLIPLTQDIVIMPLIGTVDSQRAGQVMSNLLQGIAELRARYAIVDITGVLMIDTQVANALIGAAQAVRLLGATVILTGIRPEVAQLLVGLGVDLSGIVTSGTLQQGIAFATGGAS